MKTPLFLPRYTVMLNLKIAQCHSQDPDERPWEWGWNRHCFVQRKETSLCQIFEVLVNPFTPASAKWHL